MIVDNPPTKAMRDRRTKAIKALDKRRASRTTSARRRELARKREYAADLLTRIIAHTNNLNGPEGGGFFNGLLTVDDLEEIVNRLRAGIPDADLLKFEETKEESDK